MRARQKALVSVFLLLFVTYEIDVNEFIPLVLIISNFKKYFLFFSNSKQKGTESTLV